jgi:hypothetical protein
LDLRKYDLPLAGIGKYMKIGECGQPLRSQCFNPRKGKIMKQTTKLSLKNIIPLANKKYVAIIEHVELEINMPPDNTSNSVLTDPDSQTESPLKNQCFHNSLIGNIVERAISALERYFSRDKSAYLKVSLLSLVVIELKLNL